MNEPSEAWTLLWGTLLTRGLVCLLAPLLALTPFTILGTALTELKPPLWVLLWLALRRLPRARAAQHAFAAALIIFTVGALLDGLTPSYDAAPFWSWAGDTLVWLTELASLAGLVLLARKLDAGRLAQAAIALSTAGALLSLARDRLPPGGQLIASALLAAGHFALLPPVRRRARAPRSPQPFSLDAGRGLFRWGLVELARYVLFFAALGVAAVLRVDSAQVSYASLAMALTSALLTAVGLRGLGRFTDGALGLGVRATLAHALPVTSLVVALYMLPPLLEALIVGRTSALGRVDVDALVCALLATLTVFSVSGASLRVARALLRPSLARWLGGLRGVLVGLPFAMLGVLFIGDHASWDLRRALEQTALGLVVAFVLVWLALAIMLTIAGKRLRADPA